MAIIINSKKHLWFNKVGGADSYNIRVRVSGSGLNWASVEPQNFTDVGILEDAEIELSKITALLNIDSTIDFGITAVEDNGQESEVFVIEAQEIDFLLPEAPVAGGIR